VSTQPRRWTPLGAAVIPNGQVGYDRAGSAPVSGRIAAIAPDPLAPATRVYIGSAGGGVWRTRDAGATWEPLFDDQPVMSIGALAFAPSDPTTLYVGTGEGNMAGDTLPGRGVAKIDVSGGGAVITTLFDPIFRGISMVRIAVHPADPTHLVVAATNGVYEKVGAGAWTLISQPHRATDVLWDASDADPANHRLWAAIYGQGIFVRKGVASAPLAAIPDPRGTGTNANIGRITLAQCAAQPATLYAIFGGFARAGNTADAPNRVEGIYRTDTAPTGASAASAPTSWRSLPLPAQKLGQSHYNLVLLAHPTNPEVIWMGETRLWRSTDGGQTWLVLTEPVASTPGVHADQHALAMDPLGGGPSDVAHIALWAGNDGGVWRSTDGGDTWGHRNRGLSTVQYFTLAQHPTSGAVVLGGAQDNGTQRYVDYPAWTLSALGDGCYTAIDPAQPATWYSGTFAFGKRDDGFNGIDRSDSAGEPGSWRSKAGSGSNMIGHQDDSLFYAPFVLEPASTGSSPVWLGTDRLYRSIDGGDHWTQITTQLLAPSGQTDPQDDRGVSAIAITPGHPDVVYVGTSEGNLWRLERTATDWPATPFAPIDLAPDPPAGGAPPPPRAGITPQLLAAGAASRNVCFISDIVVHPTNPSRVFVVVGTNHIAGPGPFNPLTSRLFRSDDRGDTFTAIAVPSITVGSVTIDSQHNPINTVVIDPDHPDLVYVGCDIGVFQYDSAAAAITEWRAGLPNAPVFDLEIHRATRMLRAATHGRGVWETILDTPAGVAAAADIRLRDTVVDLGTVEPVPAAVDDPVHAGTQFSATVSPDILIDTQSPLGGGFHTPSTVDYTASGPLDYLGFAALGSGLDPHRGTQARVYVQVHNRGPGNATAVRVGLYYAAKTSGSFAALPADFWTAFPGGPPSDTSAWKPIGSIATVPVVAPLNPAVVEFDWIPDDHAQGNVRLLALITSAEDAISASGTDSTAAALGSKYVAVRDFDLGTSAFPWGWILAGIGVAAVGGVVAYEELHH
jgi:hypothetical protein